ncbi:sigma-54-dependent Fis family transcriptional regulator [Clostridium sp. DL1XJH146]
MIKYLEFVAKAWDKFIEDDYLDIGLREEIAASWQRCKTYNVDFINAIGDDKDKMKLASKIEINEDLIRVAKPVMKSIYSTVEGSGFMIVLTDREGYIIEIIGDDEILEKAKKINFVKGAFWTEKVMGTNAIGTAIHNNKPLQTMGADHYCTSQHTWTCSAAPIQDEEGQLIGCINMSGEYLDAHSHTLGVVTEAAESIRKQLALIMSSNLLNVTFDSIVEGLIVLDEKFRVKRINQRAEHILGETKENILAMNIKDTLKNIDFSYIVGDYYRVYNNIECDFHVKNRKTRCIVNIVPMKENKRFMGVVITFREAKYVHKLVNKVVGYRATYNFSDIIYKSDNMEALINYAKKASQSDCNIIIEGESGTGKELISQAIHNYSSRANGPFVAVNCASIPRELVESELFGYDKGAFTGAVKEGRPGKFELADGGTVFLDELGELPIDIQTKLLRVLDNNKIVRVGGTYEKEIDVRIIGATNKILKEEIRKKSFREDLFYRINVINLNTIPLVERKEDIEVLAQHFVGKLNAKNVGSNKIIEKQYIEKLKEHTWPGNVRELRNVIERDYYFSEDTIVNHNYEMNNEKKDYSDINDSNSNDDNNNIKKNNTNVNCTCSGDFDERRLNNDLGNDNEIIPLDILEKNSIIKAIKFCDGNIIRAAALLNISRSTIYRKLNKYNIECD